MLVPTTLQHRLISRVIHLESIVLLFNHAYHSSYIHSTQVSTTDQMVSMIYTVRIFLPSLSSVERIESLFQYHSNDIDEGESP